MPDYTKQCWSCGKVTIVNKGDYCQCSNCGATWNEIPFLTGAPYTLDYIPVKEQFSGYDCLHRRPSFQATERARKKREASKEGRQ